MKYNRFYIAIFLLVIGNLAFAGGITGEVIDGSDNQPISGATVAIAGTSLSAVTDEYGRYTIANMPVGECTLKIKHKGYPVKYRSVRLLKVYPYDIGINRIKMGTYIRPDVKGPLPIKTIKINSKQLKQTHITPHLNTEIILNTNLIYCATFQIAWNSLQNNFIKEPIKIAGNKWDCEQLNKQEITETDLDSNSYLAIAGILSKKLLQRINSELSRKFGSNAPPKVDEAINPSGSSIFSYCYLCKDLVFRGKFSKEEVPLFFIVSNKKSLIQSFGFANCEPNKQKEVLKQVEILYHNSNDDFAIRLKTTSDNDELMLVKMDPKNTLNMTIEQVNNNIKAHYVSAIKKEERLMIPCLDYDIIHTFDKISSKYFLNKKWSRWVISEAIQQIRFKLNESGALLKSEARITATIGMPMMPKEERKFIFDKPFLIMLRKKGSNLPYFAMWVGNAELLCKY